MGVVENVEKIAELIKKIGDMDLYKKILSLETEVLDLTRDKRRADENIEELERALKFKEQLTFKTPYYWLEGDPAPYCSACWPSKHLAVHVVDVQLGGGFGQQMQCPSCKHVYSHTGF